MRRPEESLASKLSQAGIVLADGTEPHALETPWFVKALQALAGWLAAILIMGFIALGVAPVLDSSAVSMLLGLAMISAAYALLRIPRNEFLEHIALAVSLVGQLLLAWAVTVFADGVSAGLWWFLLVMQALLALIMPNFVHRVFSSFSASLALCFVMASIGVANLTSGLLLLALIGMWLHEFHWPRQLRLVQALGYGLVLGLLMIQFQARFGQPLLGWEDQDGALASIESWFDWVGPWSGEILSTAALAYFLRRLFQRSEYEADRRISLAAYAGAVLLFLASLQAYGLTQGAVILSLGFAISNRLLMGLGGVSLLFSISSYYYLLDATLLTKAQTLLVLGLLMLTVRWLMLRWLPVQKEHSDA